MPEKPRTRHEKPDVLITLLCAVAAATAAG